MIITKSSPSVLFFDSGMGGLSVYQAVKGRLPALNCHYLFDHAGFPYGEKSEDYLIARVGSLLAAAVKALNVRLIVVACNTASTIVLPQVRHEIYAPIVGVVPAIKPAAVISRRKIIGLLATPGTVHRRYTQDLIDNFAKNCRILRIGSTELVRLAEDYLACGISDDAKIAECVAEWVKLPSFMQPDVVVLGCTHFPLVKDSLQKALPQSVLIDSGDAIGRRVASLINTLKLKGLMGGESASYGDFKPMAFYTGNIPAEELAVRERSFKHYGFADLQPFDL